MASPRLDVSDQHGQRVVPVDKDPFTIGRRIGSDLHLTNGDVSRVHAEITAVDGGLRISDRGSRHGTFVNGEAVTEHRLVHGDRVRLGQRDGAEFVFLSDDDAAAGESSERSAVNEMHQVAVLLEGLKALSSGKVLDDVLGLVLDSAISVGRAERGFIMLAGDDDDRLEFKLGRSQDQATLPGDTFQTSRKIPEEVFRAGRSRIETDLLDGDLADQHMGTVALGIRNVLCVPLRLVRYVDSRDTVTEDRRVGVLYLDSRTKGTLLAPETGATLDALAAEAAVAIDNARLYRAAVEKARLDQEMATAAQIQRALLPTRNRTGAFFDAAAEMLPCRAIGGDFFEYIDLPDDRFGFALGDVSGKGPPAALLGALTQGSLAAQTTIASGPADALTRLNTALVKRAIEARFVTLFYAQLDPDGTLTFCNGGHNPPFLVGRSGVSRLETGGMPMGLFDGVPFAEESVTMEPGDFLVLFSDGVSEALDSAGAEFEDARIVESIAGAPGRDAPAQLEHLLSNVKKFTAGAPQNDDVTVVVIAYRGRASASEAASLQD